MAQVIVLVDIFEVKGVIMSPLERNLLAKGRTLDMDERLPRKAFDLETFRRWRLVQIVALLPLAVTVVLMIYFRETPVLFVVAFFLVLVVGVLMPQISGESILSHIVLRDEFRKEMRVLQGEVLNMRKELHAANSGQEPAPFRVMK